MLPSQLKKHPLRTQARRERSFRFGAVFLMKHIKSRTDFIPEWPRGLTSAAYATTDTYTSSAILSGEQICFALVIGATSPCQITCKKTPWLNRDSLRRWINSSTSGFKLKDAAPLRVENREFFYTFCSISPRCSAPAALISRSCWTDQSLPPNPPLPLSQTLRNFIVASTTKWIGMPHHLSVTMLALRSIHTTTLYLRCANHSSDCGVTLNPTPARALPATPGTAATVALPPPPPKPPLELSPSLGCRGVLGRPSASWLSPPLPI